MEKYFTHYWSQETCKNIKNFQDLLSVFIYGSLFREREVKSRDIVYSVTVKKKELYINCSIEVDKMVTVEEATDHLGFSIDTIVNVNKYSDYLISKLSTPIFFDQTISIDIYNKLRFISNDKVLPDKYIDPNKTNDLYNSFAYVRRITKESAELLDDFLDKRTEVKDNHIQEWRKRL